ncbi:TetR family transcriptional regulator [Siminovitchia terrae]|uniref:TetR family transcriptional regulator n=1 Tax=Siminovitchia terrae TaxID=1914933 RepID=A0A429XBB9_SIMTE|nr:TetR/AcrR family transcriptional regulator [Siminovitchia terrae]RST60642.1 TetR/AcrR family transcriptional regulator [Siminovitchia terrae]GIN94856.1 TetR family transcriptional regulator [Siminovitchia terrae]
MTSKLIIEAALKLFTQHGYEGASLADIAKEVGIHKSSIYTHFQKKEDLFFAVFDYAMSDYREHLKQLLNTIQYDSIEDILYKILCNVGQYYNHSAEKVVFQKRFLLFPPISLQDELKNRFASFDDSLIQILFSIFKERLPKSEFQSQEVKDWLNAYSCVLDGLFSHMVYYGNVGFDEKVSSVWNLFWGGIQHSTLLRK